VIIGTAGHIDHGKTALVRALTGVDTDRLPEEKRRGITIELGFAPLEISGVGTFGVVDVPGHEAFIRTMLAGATGIDLAMLVIAADEGPMPQTREHLAILSLLGVRGGVVVLTKRDLVEAEWLSLVEDDVRTLLPRSALADAEIIAVCAPRGEGLEEVRAALGRAASAIPQRAANDLFRLPVDRAFTIRGTGTVVTGTVWSGVVRRDDSVRILPGDRIARVRSLQRHGEAVDSVAPGERAAVGLVGVDLDDVPRGAVLVTAAAWAPTTVLRADVAMLDTADHEIDARTRVRFHLGTADVGARVVTADGMLAPGGRTPARIILETPVVARAGDRFVLRTPSPAHTIGGGIIDDPLPPHRRSRPEPVSPDPSAHLVRLLAEASTSGIDVAALPIRLGISPHAVDALIRGAPPIALQVGSRVYAPTAAAAIRQQLRDLVEEHHRAHPLDPGVSLQSVRARLVGTADLVEHALTETLAAGALSVDGGQLRRAGWQPTLTPAQSELLARLAATLEGSGREPPGVAELEAAHGPVVPALLRLLDRAGTVVAVETDRYYHAAVLERLIESLRERMVPGREYGPADLRELLGVSRKYLIPLLEYCDRVRVTDRLPGGRVLAGTQFASPDGDKRS
jgi:selenocysteine-specific elongation factor